MEINTQTESTLKELLEGRNWHWKKYGILQHLWIFFGLVFIILGILALKTDDNTVALFFLGYGIYATFRKKILEYRFAKTMRTSAAFEKKTEWIFQESKISTKSEVGETELKWDALYEVIITPNGFLLYPQKNLFIWLPLTGFKNIQEFEVLKEFISNSVKNKTLV